MESTVKVQKLHKSYQSKQGNSLLKNLFRPEYKTVNAVKQVSFEINKGEAVAFLGPNGAGKTTTIKMMTGLIHPTSGKVTVLGYDPYQRNFDFLKRIGLVMGNKMSLDWDLTAKQSFNLLKNIYEIDDKTFNARIEMLSTLLAVEDLQNTQLRNLSLGERMKMELIGSIIHNPEVLFLDEPTIGLDILTKKRIRTFLKEIQTREKITLILTSHDIDDIEAVCDRVIIINKGEKFFDDDIKTLVEKYQENRYVRFILEKELATKTIEELADWGSVEKRNEIENTYLFKTNKLKMVQLIAAIMTKSNVLDMQIESVPLEDIVADLFRASADKTLK